MRTTILTLIFLGPIYLTAQTVSCNDFRYLQIIFSEAEKTEEVQYGQNTTIGNVPQDLMMDVYEPVGDTATQRIPLILAVGGAFSGGSRAELEQMSENFAQRGYVVFALDIRPFDLPLDATTTEVQMLDWLIKASADVKAAVRFIRQETANGNRFGVNTDIIFTGGAGTGALAATHAAMVSPGDPVGTTIENLIMANGGWEGNSNNITDFDAEVRGVISYSGGLVDARWLDGSGPLFIAFHDENDPEIPFNGGIFSPGGTASPLMLEGGNALTQRALDLGVYHEFNSISGNGHLTYLASGTQLNSTVATTAAFIHEVNCDDILNSLRETLASDRTVYISPNPSTDMLRVTVTPEEQIINLRAFDMMGRQVISQNITSRFDVSTLPNGVYFLVVEFGDGKISRAKRWIKQ